MGLMGLGWQTPPVPTRLRRHTALSAMPYSAVQCSFQQGFCSAPMVTCDGMSGNNDVLEYGLFMFISYVDASREGVDWVCHRYGATGSVDG